MSLNDKECVTHDGGRANSPSAAYTFIHDNRDADEPAIKELPAGWWVEVGNARRYLGVKAATIDCVAGFSSA